MMNAEGVVLMTTSNNQIIDIIKASAMRRSDVLVMHFYNFDNASVLLKLI